MTADYTTFLVEDHSHDGLRSGEGAIVALANGDLLMLYSCFEGGHDADAAFIARRISCDEGRTWSKREVQFEKNEGSLNSMGVSLLRLQDGRIACSYAVKWSLGHCVPVFMTSEDEGETWSVPRMVSTEQAYFVVNNDRLIQLEDGTLVMPYARLDESISEDATDDLQWNMLCGLFYSRDVGASWQTSPHEIKFTPEIFTKPLFVEEKNLVADALKNIQHRLGIFQEPGVVQLKDGRLLMHMRSSYAIYRCYADDVTAPWKDCGVFPGLNVCCSAQTIRRLPGSNELVMLYNDRGTLRWGEQDTEFNFRTPVSVAISGDEGATWERWGTLENDSKNYCYFSLLFFQDQFIASYYESGEPAKNSESTRRNLASLKVCVGSTAIFVQNSALSKPERTG